MRALLVLVALLIPTAAAQIDLEPTDRELDWAITLSLGGVGLAAVVGLVYFLSVGGMRHVDKGNVLDHPLRSQLLQVVQEAPGIHLRELAQRHDTAVTNTQWHLRKLEMAELIRTEKVQGRRLYYPVAGGVAMKQRAHQHAVLQNENAVRIFVFIKANPGINQRNLAEGLEMNAGTVRWHLRKLEESGLLRVVPDGAQTRYYMSRPEGFAAVESLGGAAEADAARS